VADKEKHPSKGIHIGVDQMNPNTCKVRGCRHESTIMVQGIGLCEKHWCDYAENHEAGTILNYIKPKRST